MPRETFTKESSGMTWPMAMESIRISMEAGIKESSKMMCKRAMERKNGSMAPSTLGPIKTE